MHGDLTTLVHSHLSDIALIKWYVGYPPYLTLGLPSSLVEQARGVLGNEMSAEQLWMEARMYEVLKAHPQIITLDLSDDLEYLVVPSLLARFRSHTDTSRCVMVVEEKEVRACHSAHS